MFAKDDSSNDHFNIVDDWGSFEATPSYDHNNMVAVDWRATWNGSDWDVRTVRDLDGRRRVLEVTAERFGQ